MNRGKFQIAARRVINRPTLRQMSAAVPELKATLLLLVRHGETPTTGLVLPGRAAACFTDGVFDVGSAEQAEDAVTSRGLDGHWR